ncbi:MAG: enoyl-CoA hydratase/isomerase family protein [Dehalococcoidia bacterium]|nr:enoyl-CoA hydratase/isomerase family protein [Dehalococcoidia bacterium]
MKVVDIREDGAVRTVTLNRPEKRNALSGEMLDLLEAAFRREPPQDERVTVIRSTGPVFCAGLDLRERAATLDRPGASSIEGTLEAIEHYPLPVLGVVQGDAIAGGNELALHCDLVVASTTARFGMSLAQIGLAPTWFLAKKLLEVCGPVAAREVLLLGDPLPAERMHALGVISFLAAPEDLEVEATRIIQRLAHNAPLSLRAMKALLVREMAFRDEIGHEDVDALIETARRSNDAKEGIAARLEKRLPEFTGR